MWLNQIVSWFNLTASVLQGMTPNGADASNIKLPPIHLMSNNIALVDISSKEKNDRFGGAKESQAVNCKDKMKWMSSVQLWSLDVHNHATTDHLTNCNNKERKEETVIHSTVNRAAGRTFTPLKGCTVNVMDEFPALSFGTPEAKIKEKIMQSSVQQQSGRKQQRCWSPELHRRFINALQ